MSDQGKDLAVVIPTRNRVDLAINAVKSVLSQEDCHLKLIISDNSTEVEQSALLEKFCKSLDDERVLYIRPSQPLPMTQHWDWAMRQTIQLTQSSHFIYLTDRMIFKPHALNEIEDIALRYPDKTISYYYDSVNDYKTPVKLFQSKWTGKVLDIKSEYFFARASDSIFPSIIPRMLNSCVPRIVMEKICEKYGTYFSSVSPDYNFAFSGLTVVPSIFYYDKPLLINYAIGKSNGESTLRGTPSKDAVDFQNQTDFSSAMCFASPLPFPSMTNAMLHEYEYVRQRETDLKLPEFDYEKYLQALTSDVFLLENQKLKRQYLLALYKKLGTKFVKYFTNAAVNDAKRKFPIRTRLRQAVEKIGLMENLQLPTEKQFYSTEEAIAFDLNFPRRRDTEFEYIEGRLGIDSLRKNEMISILDYEPQN